MNEMLMNLNNSPAKRKSSVNNRSIRGSFHANDMETVALPPMETPE